MKGNDMGYTHYFTKDHVQPEDVQFIKLDFKSTIMEIRRRGVKLEIDDVPYVSFNGIEGKDFEQFILNEEKGFSFCKTNNEPYDLAVMVCLVIVREYLKGEIVIISDGKSEDWKPAIDICQKILGFGEDFELDSKGD